MKVQITCTYCGFQYIKEVYSESTLRYEKCTNGNCNDKRLIIKDLTNKIDYYQGSPPFPTKTEPVWPNFL